MKFIKKSSEELNVDISNVEIIDPIKSDKLNIYAKALYKMRARKGMTLSSAKTELKCQLAIVWCNDGQDG